MNKSELENLVYYILERYCRKYGVEELHTKAYLTMEYISGESDLIADCLITEGIVGSRAIIDFITYKQDIQDNVSLDYVFEAVKKLKEVSIDNKQLTK